ncbi:MAG: hypothetical protein C0609_01225 [Deltaproteobacteria bacterium]|nr:MAG: hypothetical protein C0609_01225 [Deltaproteobacteria bacterium]
MFTNRKSVFFEVIFKLKGEFLYTGKVRRYPRADLESVITIDSPEPDGGRLLLNSADIGIGGCRVLAKRPLGIGRVLQADLVLNSRVIRTLVKVVHGSKTLSGFSYGMEFLYLEPADQESVKLYVLNNSPTFGESTKVATVH